METFLNLPDNCRLWMYAANRALNEQEEAEMGKALEAFTSQWTSHDMPLQGKASILHQRVVLIAVNEAVHSVSGCGIDKSVKLMKDLGAQYGIDFFNRLQILVKQDNALVGYTKEQLQQAIDQGEVDEETLVLNPMPQSLGEFKQKGWVPLQQFWMAPQLKFSVKY